MIPSYEIEEFLEHRLLTRKLRVFAFDPSIGQRMDTAQINELTLQIARETAQQPRSRIVGANPPDPVPPLHRTSVSAVGGEYVEVIDYDPASGYLYPPLDLDNGDIREMHGLPPSEGNPQFHQQMVYAVAMATIERFERALGRVTLWADRWVRQDGVVTAGEFVQRLRIYPHALREANAYYSPLKKALLFGYFPSRGGHRGQLPGGMVFTCLSFDIVAHETTHALLDGLHPRFAEATNPDVYALHEAFADVVALFQRFSYTSILEHQIARTGGNLEKQNLLGQLAQQFGQAVGGRGALRDALGSYKNGVWEPRKPDPKALESALEPHERGAILVAAIFGAFLSIYRERSKDLFRIASNGTGIIAGGDLQPDLVRRLAREAAQAADGVLRMCIRALDYMPPVDVTFGDFLRGIITGDFDAHPEDPYNYRVAFVQSFRDWGIFPENVRSLSVDSLRHPRMDQIAVSPPPRRSRRPSSPRNIEKISWMQQEVTRLLEGTWMPSAQNASLNGPSASSKRSFFDYSGDGAHNIQKLEIKWDLGSSRKDVHDRMKKNARLFHAWLTRGPIHGVLEEFGLTLDPQAPPSVYRGRDGKTPAIEVHSVRVAQRPGPHGEISTDLVVEIVQRRRGFLKEGGQGAYDHAPEADPNVDGDFRFRRGCTLIIDTSRCVIRYAICNKGNVSKDEGELERVRKYLAEGSSQEKSAFWSTNSFHAQDSEQFAALHRR